MTESDTKTMRAAELRKRRVHSILTVLSECAGLAALSAGEIAEHLQRTSPADAFADPAECLAMLNQMAVAGMVFVREKPDGTDPSQRLFTLQRTSASSTTTSSGVFHVPPRTVANRKPQ
jgi:hypothetical protein